MLSDQEIVDRAGRRMSKKWDTFVSCGRRILFLSRMNLSPAWSQGSLNCVQTSRTLPASVRSWYLDWEIENMRDDLAAYLRLTRKENNDTLPR